MAPSAAISSKRVLLIGPFENGDFPRQLVTQLILKGMNVYAWTFSIENSMMVLEQFPEKYAPIMINVTAKDNGRDLLNLLPSMNFIIKFSESKKSLSENFIRFYGYLFGSSHQQNKARIKEVPRKVDKIIAKMEKCADSGLVLNIGPIGSEGPVAILTQPLTKFLKPKTKSGPNESDEDSPLLEQPESSSNIGATINLDRQNGSIGIAFRCFGCCGCLDNSAGDNGEGDLDARIRAALRRVHLNAKENWQTVPSNVQKNQRYHDLVQMQFDALSEIVNP